jgi:hypothetical protein
MKNLRLSFYFSVLFLFLSEVSLASFNIYPEYAKAFIENRNQFNGRNKLPGSEILYAIDHGPYQVYFTRSGLTYRLDKKLPRKKWDKSKPLSGEEEWNQIMAMRRAVHMESTVIPMNWVDANPSVEIVADEKLDEYFSYSMGSNNVNYNNVRGFKKIIYRNLYPDIDAEYVFHPEKGFKYSFTVRPGADPTKIKLSYS